MAFAFLNIEALDGGPWIGKSDSQGSLTFHSCIESNNISFLFHIFCLS